MAKSSTDKGACLVGTFYMATVGRSGDMGCVGTGALVDRVRRTHVGSAGLSCLGGLAGLSLLIVSSFNLVSLSLSGYQSLFRILSAESKEGSAMIVSRFPIDA